MLANVLFTGAGDQGDMSSQEKQKQNHKSFELTKPYRHGQDDFKLIISSYRCPQCGEEKANQSLLTKSAWRRDAEVDSDGALQGQLA